MPLTKHSTEDWMCGLWK